MLQHASSSQHTPSSTSLELALTSKSNAAEASQARAGCLHLELDGNHLALAELELADGACSRTCRSLVARASKHKTDRFEPTPPNKSDMYALAQTQTTV